MDQRIKTEISSYYDFWFGMNAVYESWAKARGLNSNGLFTLYTISEFKGQCTQRMLCEKLLLAKQTVNTILDGFENKGYIRRVTCECDKRSKTIEFTRQGEAYAQTILGELAAFEERALLQMEDSQRAAMLETNHIFLEKLRTAAGAADTKED